MPVTNNIIMNNKAGIFLGNLSNNNVISNNIITNNNGEGINLFISFDNLVIKNNLTKQDNFAIVLWELSHSNIVSQNCIYNNKNGIGLRRWSDKNIIYNKTIVDNGMEGKNNKYNSGIYFVLF